jgi:hypothetical protein
MVTIGEVKQIVAAAENYYTKEALITFLSTKYNITINNSTRIVSSAIAYMQVINDNNLLRLPIEAETKQREILIKLSQKDKKNNCVECNRRKGICQLQGV